MLDMNAGVGAVPVKESGRFTALSGNAAVLYRSAEARIHPVDQNGKIDEQPSSICLLVFAGLLGIPKLCTRPRLIERWQDATKSNVAVGIALSMYGQDERRLP